MLSQAASTRCLQFGSFMRKERRESIRSFYRRPLDSRWRRRGHDRLPHAVANWQYREPAADPAAISALSAAASIELPERYLVLLALTNGGAARSRSNPAGSSSGPSSNCCR